MYNIKNKNRRIKGETFKALSLSSLFLFSSLFFIFLIGFVSPNEFGYNNPKNDFGTYKQYSQIRFTQICSDSTWINISSISYPDSTIAFSNIEMISSGNGEFYILFDDTSELGRYDVRGISDGCENTFATYFTITSTGNEKFDYWFIIIGTALALFFLMLSVLTPEELFVYISGLFFLIEGIFIMINGFALANNDNTRMFAYIYLGLGMLFTLGAYIFNLYSNKKEEDEEYF